MNENDETAQPLSKLTFYGQQSGNKHVQRKLSQKEKELKMKHVAPDYKPRLDSPDSNWRVFHRQNDAIEFARSHSAELHVFAYESDSFLDRAGQRLYLVSSYEHFWHYYSRLPSEQRHHYEVIPQDAVCNLYADLEFDKMLNPGKSGEHMLICHWLKKIFNIDCKANQVLSLDASTNVKFSCHLIFRLSEAAFRNNISAGHFMKFVYSRLLHDLKDESLTRLGTDAEQRDSPSSGLMQDDLRQLLINHRNGKQDFFCDLCVYTRNRNFRLFLSSKLGKNNPLVLSQVNHFEPNPTSISTTPSKRRKISSDEILFLSSLVSRVEYSDEVQMIDFGIDNEAESIDKCALSDQAPCTTAAAAASDSGYQSSPYPEVDTFVKSVVVQGGVQGAIWRWAFFNDTGKIVYDIVKNRWCENIGRAHKSNNIIIVVDLKNGTYYQKCHDLDCRAVNFKSAEHSLPQNLFEKWNHESNSGDGHLRDNEVMDDDLVRACISVENSLNKMPQESEVSDEELIEAAQLAEESLGCYRCFCLAELYSQENPYCQSTPPQSKLPTVPQHFLHWSVTKMELVSVYDVKDLKSAVS